MGFRDMRHLYLPEGNGNGDGSGNKSGDGGANGGAGAPPQDDGKGPQNDGGGSNGSNGSGDNPPGNQPPQNGNQGGGNGQVPIDQLPQGWQDHIRELRTENKSRREGQADYDKYKAFYDGIQGVVSPEQQKTPDQLRSDIETERARTRQSEVKLAIYQNAAVHGADPSALLDSASFLGTVSDLDPTASDFATKMGERIKTAVEGNGRLKASSGGTRQQNNGGGAPGSSGSAPFQGGQGNGTQLTRDDLKSMSPEQIEKARVEGRLKTLLGS